MQQIFIPPIGSVITLGKPWNFTLYCELRNFDLGKRAGLLKVQTRRELAASQGRVLSGLEERGADEPYRWTSLWVAKEEADRAWDVYKAECEAAGRQPDWNRYPRDVAAAEITFPKGTDLKVDRIYIRRGCAGFDSVTFWADVPHGALVKVVPTVKPETSFTITLDSRKKTRFWAKLAEVNHIVALSAEIPTETAEEV